MKSSILFLVLILFINKSQAQVLFKNCGNDSLDVCLFKIESDLKRLKELLVEIESLEKDSLFDDLLFQRVSKTILNTGITEGYNFVLNNSYKFKRQKFMNAVDILRGKTPVIWDILKSMKGDKIKKFIDYILYSDYLNQDLSEQQLEHLSSIVNYNRDALYHSTHNKSLRESNLQSIYKINTKQ